MTTGREIEHRFRCDLHRDRVEPGDETAHGIESQLRLVSAGGIQFKPREGDAELAVFGSEEDPKYRGRSGVVETTFHETTAQGPDCGHQSH